MPLVESALGEVLPRMNPEHWEALEFVQRTGTVPIAELRGAYDDLKRWGVVRSIGIGAWRGDAQLTELGQLVAGAE